MKKKEIVLYIPENLDIESLLPQNLKGANRQKFIDRAHFFIDLIFKKLQNKKCVDQYIKTGYINLKCEYFRDAMSYEHVPVINFLTEHGIIDVNTHFKLGKSTRGYILTDKYINSNLKKVRVVNTIVYNAVNEKKRSSNNMELAKNIPHTIAQLDKKWHIDVDGCTNWINQYLTKIESKLESAAIPDDDKQKILSRYKAYYKHIMYLIILINNGEAEYIIDNKGQRIHTAFTSLPRPIKNFLTIDNQTLIALDIKNSQPLLFTAMASKDFFAKKQLNKDLLTLKTVYKDLYESINSPSNAITMREINKMFDGQGFRESNFRKFVLNGTIYDFIMEKCKGKYYHYSGYNRFQNRPATKEEFFTIMYGETPKGKNAVYYHMESLFPLEFKAMRLIKSINYKQFSILLQRIESTLMLHKVGENINENIPFLTIHDSIIIPNNEAYINEVTDLITFKFNQHMQILPKIGEVEYLTPENAFKSLDAYVEEKFTKIALKYKKSR